MLSSLLFSVPYIIFYIYAIRVCRQKREIAPRPAKVTLFVCWALLAQMSVVIVMQGLLQADVINVNRFFLFMMGLGGFVGWGCLATALFCVFAWRPQKEGVYKKPAILTGISFLLRIVAYLFIRRMRMGHDMSSASLIVDGIVLAALNIGSDIFLLKAIFEGRSASDMAVSQTGVSTGTSPVVSSGETTASPVPAPAAGMFKEADYVPFVCGVMILGGLVIVPIMWGGFTGLGYGDSIFPSLVSCGIFAYAHDKQGRFLFGRFLAMMVVFVVTLLRTSLQSRGNGRPMFMAGGILGYLVMLACGWAGIAVGRAFRKSTKNG